MAELRNYLDNEGKLKVFPAKRKNKIIALEYLASKLDFGVVYSEIEIGEQLSLWHTFGDVATLRRELFDFGFIDRTKDGTSYVLLKKEANVE